MYNDLLTIEDLRNNNNLDNLNEQEQLALISNLLPKLEIHEVANYFPNSSESDLERFEKTLQPFLMAITRDFKIVTQAARYNIARKLARNDELTFKPVVFFTDNEAASILTENFTVLKLNRQQEAALVYQIGFKYQQKKSRERMADKTKSGSTNEILAKTYKVSRCYLDNARSIDIQDEKNATNYLKFIIDGKASFDQILKTLIKTSDIPFKNHMVKKLEEVESTYDNAQAVDGELVDRVAKVPKVGTAFWMLKKSWERKQKKVKAEETKVAQSIAHVQEAMGHTVSMPTTHAADLETVSPTLSKHPKYKVISQTDIRDASDASIKAYLVYAAKGILECQLTQSSFSIRFNNRYVNVSLPNEEEDEEIHAYPTELNGDIF